MVHETDERIRHRRSGFNFAFVCVCVFWKIQKFILLNFSLKIRWLWSSIFICLFVSLTLLFCLFVFNLLCQSEICCLWFFFLLVCFENPRWCLRLSHRTSAGRFNTAQHLQLANNRGKSTKINAVVCLRMFVDRLICKNKFLSHSFNPKNVRLARKQLV